MDSGLCCARNAHAVRIDVGSDEVRIIFWTISALLGWFSPQIATWPGGLGVLAAYIVGVALATSMTVSIYSRHLP